MAINKISDGSLNKSFDDWKYIGKTPTPTPTSTSKTNSMSAVEAQKIKNMYDQYRNTRVADDKAYAEKQANSSSSGYTGSSSYGGYSAPSYASAPKYDVPDMDFGVFDTMRSNVENSADTSRTALQNSFDAMMRGLDTSREQTKRAFEQGRSTISEDAYNNKRNNAMELASRGLGASGLAQLGDVQSRMAVGNEVSELASGYNDTVDSLAETQRTGTEGYQTATNTLQDQLASQQAEIEYQQWQAENAYNSALASANYDQQVLDYNRANSIADSASSYSNQMALANLERTWSAEDALSASTELQEGFKTWATAQQANAMDNYMKTGDKQAYADTISYINSTGADQGILPMFNVSEEYDTLSAKEKAEKTALARDRYINYGGFNQLK